MIMEESRHVFHTLQNRELTKIQKVHPGSEEFERMWTHVIHTKLTRGQQSVS